MSKDIKLSALRLPVDLHTKIVAASQENGRSQHAEMLHRIQASFSEPVLPETHAALAALDKVAQNVMADVLTRFLTGVEDRLAALIAKKMEAAEMSLITEVKFEGDPFASLRRFESAGWKGTRSPTGRLSDTQPEPQDLPAVSGINTLAAGVCGKGYHSGGYCGLPEGEYVLPLILERGGYVLPYRSKEREGEWIENTGVEPEGLTDQSILDLKTNTGNPVLGHRYLQGSSKGAKIWKKGGRVQVTHWRHSAYSQQQTLEENITGTPPEQRVSITVLNDAEKMAGPYGFNGNYDGWTPKGIGLPLGPDAMVDVLYEDGGRLYHKRMGEIDWSNIRSPSRNVTHWRLAK